MRPLSRAVFILALATAAAATVVLEPAEAVAQSAEQRLASMLEQAINDYDVLEIESARDKLDEALQLAAAQGVGGPPVARIHVMLGIVEFGDTRDEGLTQQHFMRALREDRSAQIDPVYQTPSLVDLMDRARAEVGPELASGAGSSSSKEGTTQEEGGEATVSGFEHEPVRSARAGQPFELEAYMPPDMPVYRVWAYYRTFGGVDYTRVELTATSATRFAVEVPGADVRTSQVDYYIEAEDRAGNVLANAGGQTTPFNITVLGSSDYTPPDDGGSGDPDLTDDPGLDAPTAPSGQVVYLNLNIGSGAGFLGGGEPTGRPEVPVKGGVAPTFAHALLDLGYLINDQNSLGVYLRWQFSPSQNFETVPEASKEATGFPTTEEECLGLGLPGDCLVGLKYRYFFETSQSLRLYGSGGAGVGRTRNWIRLKQYDDPNALTECAGKSVSNDAGGTFCFVRDTVRPGWLHVGAGLGAEIPLSSNIALAADSFLYLLVPEVAFQLDAQVGLNLRF